MYGSIARHRVRGLRVQTGAANEAVAWYRKPGPQLARVGPMQRSLLAREPFASLLRCVIGLPKIGHVLAEETEAVRLSLPNARSLLSAALVLSPALTAPAAHAEGKQVRALDGYEAVRAIKGSDAAALITQLVERQLLAIPGVRSVHDLHVRSITSGIDTLSAHVVVADMAEATRILKAVRRMMAAEFNTSHVTVQVETEGLQAEETIRKT